MVNNDDITFSYESYSYYSPILIIKPTGSLGKKCSFHLNVVPESNIYSLHKFSPNINNICYEWYFNDHLKNSKSCLNIFVE